MVSPIEWWFRHRIILHRQGGFTASGPTPETLIMINASINTESRKILGEHGEEIVSSATLCWSPDSPMPKLGDLITLPDEFGAKPRRKVIAVRRAKSAAPHTPDHIEVSIQ